MEPRVVLPPGTRSARNLARPEARVAKQERGAVGRKQRRDEPLRLLRKPLQQAAQTRQLVVVTLPGAAESTLGTPEVDVLRSAVRPILRQEASLLPPHFESESRETKDLSPLQANGRRRPVASIDDRLPGLEREVFDQIRAIGRHGRTR